MLRNDEVSVALTPREAQIAAILDDGWSYGEVALFLGISMHTVASHAKAIHRKCAKATLADRAPAFPADLKLTPRERTVAQLIVGRMTQTTIAAALGISFHTVRTHVRSILGKTGTPTTRRFLAFVRQELSR